MDSFIAASVFDQIRYVFHPYEKTVVMVCFFSMNNPSHTAAKDGMTD